MVKEISANKKQPDGKVRTCSPTGSHSGFDAPCVPFQTFVCFCSQFQMSIGGLADLMKKMPSIRKQVSQVGNTWCLALSLGTAVLIFTWHTHGFVVHFLEDFHSLLRCDPWRQCRALTLSISHEFSTLRRFCAAQCYLTESIYFIFNTSHAVYNFHFSVKSCLLSWFCSFLFSENGSSLSSGGLHEQVSELGGEAVQSRAGYIELFI